MRPKDRFSKITHMWTIAMFDLPMDTAEKRKIYTKFRKELLAEGFCMLQLSVYARFCESHAHCETFARRIQQVMPPDGQVRIFNLTDKQFGEMKLLWGRNKPQPPEPPPEQLLLL